MNKKLKFFALHFSWIALLFFVQSCDVIDEPVIGVRNTFDGEVPEFTPLNAPTRVVLLEDFTGHDCGNCPIAHGIATTLLIAYEDELAVIAIHAGSLAEPFPPSYPDDWSTPEGTFYLLDQIGSDQLPTGRLNRVNGANFALSPSQWTNKLNQEFAKPLPPLGMQIVAEYFADQNKINVHVNSQWFENKSGDYRLVILLAESGIIAPQLNYTVDPTYIPDYEHNHMLRTSLTGATGLSLTTNPIAGDIKTDSYSLAWNSLWTPENCEIIAFVTEGEGGEVINAVKTKLTP